MHPFSSKAYFHANIHSFQLIRSQTTTNGTRKPMLLNNIRHLYICISMA